MATLANSRITRIGFSDLIDAMAWSPGEHVTLIGPTGRGKTETLISLMERRRWGVFLGTKRVDGTQDRLRSLGYRTIHNPHELHPEVASKFLFRPKFPRMGEARELQKLHSGKFREVLLRIRAQTGWTVGVDECRYITDHLKLADEMEMLWLQGRSEGTTIIANTQRPRYIPLEAYDQATHLFLWSDPDMQNLSRVAEMASMDRLAVLDTLPGLSKHDFLYANTVTGDMFISNSRS